MLPDLLHGEERKVWGDGAYQGQTEAIHGAAPKAQDMTSRRTRYKNYVDEEAKRKNTHQGPRESQSRASFPHPQTDLRIYQGALPGYLEEPPVAVRGLRAGQPVPAPQPAGPARGVVSPEAGKRPQEAKHTTVNQPFATEKCFKNERFNCNCAVATKSRTCAEVP